MVTLRQTISLAIGLGVISIGHATTDCMSQIAAQGNEPITRADLMKYDQCMKTEVAAPRAPLTLSQGTWQAACSSGAYTANKCFGGDPAINADTKLLLQVTNIYAMANLSLTATYPANSIWIGYFPAGAYANRKMTEITHTNGVQAVCSAYTEVGWPIGSAGINTDYTTTTGGNLAGSAQVMYTNATGEPLSDGSALVMVSSAGISSQAVTKTPLYIICVGRSTAGAPAALPTVVGDVFQVTWPEEPSH